MSDQLQGLTRRVTTQGRPLTAASSARAYNSGTQTLTTATYTAITLNSERWDDDGYHSTSVNTSRLTAPVSGRYHIGASLGFASNATGVRQLLLQVNGTTVIARDERGAVNGDNTRITIHTLYELAAGDYVEMVGYQSSGGNLATEATAAVTPEFWIERR